MDYSMMVYGGLGFLALIVVVAGVVIWRRKKKKQTHDEIYPMW